MKDFIESVIYLRFATLLRHLAASVVKRVDFLLLSIDVKTAFWEFFFHVDVFESVNFTGYVCVYLQSFIALLVNFSNLVALTANVCYIKFTINLI